MRAYTADDSGGDRETFCRRGRPGRTLCCSAYLMATRVGIVRTEFPNVVYQAMVD